MVRTYREALEHNEDALVGGYSTTVSSQLAILGSIDKMPQCSYLSASLLDTGLYPYFGRRCGGIFPATSRATCSAYNRAHSRAHSRAFSSADSYAARPPPSAAQPSTLLNGLPVQCPMLTALSVPCPPPCLYRPDDYPAY